MQLDKILRHGYVIFFLFYHFSESFNYMFLPVVGSHPLAVAIFCKDSIFLTFIQYHSSFHENLLFSFSPLLRALNDLKDLKELANLILSIIHIYINNKSNKMYMVCSVKISCQNEGCENSVRR